jgi:hypothetical protein
VTDSGKLTDALANGTDDMTSGRVRTISTPNTSFLRWKSFLVHTHRLLVAPVPALRQRPQSRSLAQVRPEPFSELWFTPSSPSRGPADELLGPSTGPATDGSDHKPPDERILKLGKSECATLPPNLLTDADNSQRFARFHRYSQTS